MDKKQLYKKAIEKWGKEAQILMLFEEMAELQKAVCKLNRTVNGGDLNIVIDEIADVEIMIEQLRELLHIQESLIDFVKKQKLERLEELLSA